MPKMRKGVKKPNRERPQQSVGNCWTQTAGCAPDEHEATVVSFSLSHSGYLTCKIKERRKEKGPSGWAACRAATFLKAKIREFKPFFQRVYSPINPNCE